MEVEILRDPYCIIIKNCYGSKSDLFLKEIEKNKKFFTESTIGYGEGKIDKNIRSNTTAMYDDLYLNKRDLSPLLVNSQKFFNSNELHQLLGSAPLPFSLFNQTNTHETQVSRYGDSSQKYDWHIDKFNDPSRLITFSYYLHTKPKKFNGGEIILSDGLLSMGKVYGETNRHTITPENDMLVIFNSTTPHCVMPTSSPKIFMNGRFSVQQWLGIK